MTVTDPAVTASFHRVTPAQLRPTGHALALLDRDVAAELAALPLVADGNRVVVALAAPPDEDLLRRLRAHTGRAVVPVVTDPSGLAVALAAAYHHHRPATKTSPVPVGDNHEFAHLGGKPVGHLDELLTQVLAVGGSDLHLSAGSRPTVRVHGHLRRLEEFASLTSDDIQRIVYGVLDDGRIESFEHELELDTAYTVAGQSRFRMNVFRQRGSIGAVLRAIPFRVPDFDTLGLPPVVKTFADLPRGLVLVTGPTGSGKSTTLASLLDIINRTKDVHILSCEDPIEFLHTHQRALVNQREVGSDTKGFAAALKRALREDPDVILVGEMRDLETIHMALTAAETGHLVFATLHTQSAPQTVDRMVDVFPPEQQGQVRVMLATTLQAVVTQQLVPASDERGRVVAAEVLVVTPAIRNLIREAKGYQIPTQMQAGAQHGMLTMDQTLAGLVRSGRITLEAALQRAGNVQDLRNVLGLRG